MFNHPLVIALCGVLLTSVVGYLINQLPAIKQFPGKNILVVKLTIETVVLVGIYSLWNTTNDKSLQLEVLLATVGVLTSVFLIWHTFKLIWMLRKTTADHSSNDNTTTELKSPDDWRRELLKVMKIDVEKRLNDSLHHNKIIRIATEERGEAVGRNSVNASIINNQPSLKDKLLQPLRNLEVFGIRKTQLEAGKPIIEAFDESDIAGRLLILGNPGAGKTTLLLELARDLIIRAQDNSANPIPVLFELTNWRDDQQIISNWLQADLKFRYNIPEKISREWLSTEQLVPMLDGLDELGLTRQRICIDKINEFLQSNSNLLPLVVCCREEEYQQGETILNNLRGAVCLQPLSEQQIQRYLRELGCKHLWEGIRNDADGLGELAKTPLFLNLIPVAYPDGLVSKSKRFNSEDEKQKYQEKCRQELFNQYIEKRLGEYHDRKGYKAEDVKRWLIWLAKTMKEQKLKEFYIEKMQPSYLDNRRQRILYSLVVGLIGGLIFGLIFGLIGGLIFGLILGLIFGLIFGLIYGLVSLFEHKIETVETLKIGFDIKSCLIFGLISGLILGLITGLIYGLIFGLISGLIVGLASGLKGSELINKNDANTGIKKSTKNTIIFTLIALPLTILLFFSVLHILSANINILGLVLFGLGTALLFGITFAGIPVIQHFSLRLILWKNRSIPWNYARFLKYADDRKLIDQVGGRFTFIHDKLQSHFAQM
ncbi:MAG: NACHT domain-containing protein [Richelia sp. SL_2_1]|nr:NACHT domain-containing protein [Richelia sp. SL_2_1]